MNHRSVFRQRTAWRLLSVFLPLLLIFGSILPAQTVYADEETMSAPPSIVSMAAVVMDAETGQVLYEKAMDKQMAPASITKIISAIVALESGVALAKGLAGEKGAVCALGSLYFAGEIRHVMGKE